MNIPIIGDAIEGVSNTVQSYFEGKKAKVQAKAKKAVEIATAKADEKINAVREEGKSTRKAIEAESGTKRALIAKNMRLMRRVVMVVLLLPFFTGALIIAGTYLSAWWNGVAPEPDFTALSLFWSEVVDGTPSWWVDAIQGMFAFLWAGGEITNVGAQAGGAIMDHIKQRGAERVREKEAEAEAARENRRAERERRNRDKEARGEKPEPDEESGSRIPRPPRSLP
ncbi:hypothetical protein [Halofilum ochraceum]|uniref:hypothetical protein n=1 Tax=Halofilum ochraceum TaxID=1611323 RepID=UPI0008DB2AD1|nr:hypothetical protein [Halofilum ochraceum]